jgi:hypothetical protein
VSRSAEILNELKELNCSLADVPAKNPFAVPERYFENLAQMLSVGVRVSQVDDDPIPVFPEALPFEVPIEYFKHLPQKLARAAKECRLNEGIHTAFEIPTGYIDGLPVQLTRIAQQADTMAKKVNNIALTRQLIRIGKMAAAAILVLGIGLGSYKILHERQPEAIAARQLSGIDKEAITTYLEQHVDELDAETLETITVSSHTDPQRDILYLKSSEIQEYLQETGEVRPANSESETL